MTTKDRIFLAHASEDKPQVRQLYDQLKAKGFSPWLDAVDLIPGQNWRQEIPKAIREAAICLACLSKRSIAKHSYVQKEFRYAMSAYADLPSGSIYLIPVRLDDCEVPDLRIAELELNLRDLHWVDLFDDDGFEKLVDAVKLNVKPARKPKLQPKPFPKAKTAAIYREFTGYDLEETRSEKFLKSSITEGKPRNSVIFGTANGLFAEGTGLLSHAWRYSTAFEFQTRLDDVPYVPSRPNRALIRRPLVSKSGKRFDLLVTLIAARDYMLRGGFLGAGVLLSPDSQIENFKAAQQEVAVLLSEAKSKYLTERHVFHTVPQRLAGSGDDGISALRADVDGTSFVRRITMDQLDSEMVAQALFAITQLSKSARSIGIVTADKYVDAPELNSAEVSDLTKQLRLEWRRGKYVSR